MNLVALEGIGSITPSGVLCSDSNMAGSFVTLLCYLNAFTTEQLELLGIGVEKLSIGAEYLVPLLFSHFPQVPTYM